MEEKSPSLIQKQLIKDILFVLLLIVAFPIGLIVMWLYFKKWPFVAKILITLLPIVTFMSSLRLNSFFANYEADTKYVMLKEENSRLKTQINNVAKPSPQKLRNLNQKWDNRQLCDLNGDYRCDNQDFQLFQQAMTDQNITRMRLKNP